MNVEMVIVETARIRIVVAIATARNESQTKIRTSKRENKLAYPPTQAVITYLTYSNANPAVITTAAVTLNIPPASNFSDFVATILRRGFWTAQNMSTNNPATQVFIPAAIITNITCS